MKVLAIIEASRVTGPAKNLVRFIKSAPSLDGAPLRFIVVTYMRAKEQNSDFLRACRAERIETAVLQERCAGDPGAVIGLARLIRGVAPDVIQTHNVKSHLFVSLANRRAAIPWIAFHHGYTSTSPKQRFYDLCDYWSLRRATRVTTVCEAFKQVIQERGVRESCISWLHNSVDVADSDGRSETAMAGPFTFLAMGRLSKEKGHCDLVKAFAILTRKLPNADLRLRIVGEGPERARLKALAKRLGVDEKVVIAGHTKRPDLEYRNASAFVLPSYSEGSSNVLLEAMSQRLPIIATEVGGNPEIVYGDSSALLVPPGAPGALGAAMHRIVTDASLRETLAAGALDRVQLFSFRSYRQNLLDVYRLAVGSWARS